MAITAAQVKELRDKTGAGMMDCKKALAEAEGDFEKAIDILRKKGASVAAKRADKAAEEGLVFTAVSEDGSEAFMMEVNCETDFVANSNDFKNFADFALKAFVENKPATVEELLTLSVDGKSISEELTATVGKIGEKIEVSRIAHEKAENGAVIDYIHHGSKLGVLIRIDNVGDKVAEITAVAKDIAMQVAAMKPLYTFREQVPSELIEKEIEIYKEVARKEGKPEQILEKIATGKLNKYYSEICLFEQAYIKDNAKSIKDILKDFDKAHGTDVKLKLFHRFHLSDEKK